MSGTYIGAIAPISFPWPLVSISGTYGTPYKLQSIITTHNNLESVITADIQLTSQVLGR